MARLVVYTRDIPGDESHKRGDVISVRNDGEPLGGDIEFGVLQKDGTRVFLWRVVDVPGSASQYEHLTQCFVRIQNDASKSYPMRKKRVDLDLIEGAAAGSKGRAIVSGETISASLVGLDAVTTDVTVIDNGVVLPADEKP